MYDFSKTQAIRKHYFGRCLNRRAAAVACILTAPPGVRAASMMAAALGDQQGVAFRAVHKPVLLVMRRDHQPESGLRRGSGLPVPAKGSRVLSWISLFTRASKARSLSCQCE